MQEQLLIILLIGWVKDGDGGGGGRFIGYILFEFSIDCF